VDERLATHPRRVAQQAEVHLGPARAQVARGDQTVAAVVAGAAQHQDAQPERRPVTPLHRLDRPGAGAFHHLLTRGDAARHRGAVEEAHLLGGDQGERHERLTRA